MKNNKEIIHSFIIRIWIEPREIKTAKPVWRGVIENVDFEHPGDEKPVYFDQFDNLRAYFAKYLENKMGLKPDSHENGIHEQENKDFK